MQASPYKKQAEKIINDYFAIFKIEIPAGMEYLNLRNYEWARKCALLAIDEKITSIRHQKELYSSTVAWKLNNGKAGDYMRESCVEHIVGLQELKKEIQNSAYGG